MKDEKKLRVSYVGFFHETNTYLTEGMGETTLDRMRSFRGDQIKQLKGTAIGGPVDVCEEKGWELLPGVLFYPDWCFGMVNDQAWNDAKKDIMDTLKSQLPLDIVYLCVHGAGMVNNTPDLEGDLAESVRALVVKDTMIVWSGDLHGKITEDRECMWTRPAISSGSTSHSARTKVTVVRILHRDTCEPQAKCSTENKQAASSKQQTNE